jgi:putative transposase
MCYGPEFISRALDQWAYMNKVTLDFSRPGKPTDNAFVESFNGRLRDECLNTHWFLSLDDARAKIEAWRRDFNESRPHTSPGFMMLAALLHRLGLTPADEAPDLSFWADTNPGQGQKRQISRSGRIQIRDRVRHFWHSQSPRAT